MFATHTWPGRARASGNERQWGILCGFNIIHSAGWINRFGIGGKSFERVWRANLGWDTTIGERPMN